MSGKEGEVTEVWSGVFGGVNREIPAWSSFPARGREVQRERLPASKPSCSMAQKREKNKKLRRSSEERGRPVVMFPLSSWQGIGREEEKAMKKKKTARAYPNTSGTYCGPETKGIEGGRNCWGHGLGNTAPEELVGGGLERDKQERDQSFSHL